jgi:hypothetical protein
VSAPMSDLPDILNSTLPPYTSPEHTLTRSGINNRGHVRRSFGRPSRVGHRRRDVHPPHDVYVLEDDLEDLCDKNCCTACLTVSTQFKWILVLLAIIGLCCVVTGIILGALHMTGSSFLTLSLMFIGKYQQMSSAQACSLFQCTLEMVASITKQPGISCRFHACTLAGSNGVCSQVFSKF